MNQQAWDRVFSADLIEVDPAIAGAITSKLNRQRDEKTSPLLGQEVVACRTI
jgi:hypothetical protein